MSLSDLGWDLYVSSIALGFDAAGTGLEPGRVLTGGPIHRLACAAGERAGRASGRLRHAAAGPSDLPAVGDWVLLRPADATTARIERILPRISTLRRRDAGGNGTAQVVAANVDIVLIVMGLDGDYNPRRLERYLLMVHECGAAPAVILTKVDRCPDPEARRAEAGLRTAGAPLLLVNGLDPSAGARIGPLIPAARTAALVGSSGAGKSTLVNRLLGHPAQATRQVRPGDDRGRHTTTRRELFRLPGGGLLIDNPGIREVGPAGDGAEAAYVFDEIAALAPACRFRDCGHVAEPGCAVAAAVASGELDAGRLRSFHSLMRELRYETTRRDDAARREQTRRWRVAHRALRREERAREERRRGR